MFGCSVDHVSIESVNSSSTTTKQEPPKMEKQDAGMQEARSERVGVMVTPNEKRAVRWVADAHMKTESDLVRDMTINQISTEYVRLRSLLGLPDAA